MERVKVEGIVIKELSFQESSKILTILTKEYGPISVISKGCKSMKSKLRSVSLKLVYATFYIHYKEDGLSTLTQADIINPLKNIIFDMEKASYVSYILELTSKVMKENKRFESIFHEMITGILKINEGLDEKVITNILEIKYLEYLGILPHLDSCVFCGNQKNIVTISVKDGGYVCQNCYKSGKLYNENVVKLISLFFHVDLEKVTKLEIKPQIRNEIDEFLDIYYTEYTGLYLNSKAFLKKLKKVGR